MKPADPKTVKFPATLRQLKDAGWQPVYSRDCKLCHMPLEFWRTPAGKLAPLESVLLDGKWLLISHWSSCVFADKFRKEKAAKPAPTKTQGDLFGGAE